MCFFRSAKMMSYIAYKCLTHLTPSANLRKFSSCAASNCSDLRLFYFIWVGDQWLWILDGIGVEEWTTTVLTCLDGPCWSWIRQRRGWIVFLFGCWSWTWRWVFGVWGEFVGFYFVFGEGAPEADVDHDIPGEEGVALHAISIWYIHA